MPAAHAPGYHPRASVDMYPDRARNTDCAGHTDKARTGARRGMATMPSVARMRSDCDHQAAILPSKCPVKHDVHAM